MNTNLDDARMIVGQLLYVMEHVREDGGPVEVPRELCELGPVELSPDGVRERLETLVAGACRALLAVLDVATTHGLAQQDALEQAAMALAGVDPGEGPAAG